MQVKSAPKVISCGESDCGESGACGFVLVCGHRGSHPTVACHAWMVDAIRAGDLPTLKSLYKEGHGPAAEYTLIAAAEHGQVACVQYLTGRLQFFDDFSSERGRRLAAFGPPPFGVDKRQWVHGVCDHLAERGNLMALQTLVWGGYYRPQNAVRGRERGLQGVREVCGVS